MSTPLPFTVFNTSSRALEPIAPRTPGKLGVYCCGPTVYDFQHIGNFKTFIFEDLLVRAFRYAGYEVTHVMNITDVGHLVGDGDEGEDKMLLAMRREGKKSAEIADYYTEIFFNDWKKLNLCQPDIVCKATEHIPQMVALIERIEKNGFTYLAGGNVYFDTSKSKEYGALARLDLEKLKAGARVQLDPNKRNPADFVLWFTKSKFENQELQWDSPWGRGYPGWHIECSAMSMHYLGEQFDVHCGGIDHIPVHHTNEIAQSEAATLKPWVSVWMHSEFIMVNAEKMSKSRGKFLILDDIIERGLDPLAYRFLCLNSHYRAQLNFTWDILDNARHAFDRFKGLVLAIKQQTVENAGTKTHAANELSAPFRERFAKAVTDDLNLPLAMSVVWEVVNHKALSPTDKWGLLSNFDLVLGLDMSSWHEDELALPPAVQDLVNEREAARKEKLWQRSDELRDQIGTLGFVVTDSAGGQKIKKV